MALREEILEEDRQRAAYYRLLSRLLVRTPDQEALTLVAGFDGGDSTLGTAVGALAAAAAAHRPADIEDEFQNLFIGIGRGELVPFGSFYLTGFLHEKPLARLRQDMAAFGIERADGVREPEDHIASVCEMMSGLILGEVGEPASLSAQADFFDRHIGPWAGQFFEDLQAAKSASFYKAVGALGRTFMEIETTAFKMAA